MKYQVSEEDGAMQQRREQHEYGTPAERTLAINDYRVAYKRFHGIDYAGDLGRVFYRSNVDAIKGSVVALEKRAEVLKNARAS